MAASSHKQLLALALLVLVGCHTGSGDGEVTGSVTSVACDLDGAFSFEPSFFAANASHDVLEIRLQSSSAFPDVVDGLTVAVNHVPEVLASLGAPIPIALTGAEALVQLTMVFGKTCPVHLADGVPVLMSAIEGEIVFDALYSPEHPTDSKRIAGHFEDVRFVDPASPDESFAVLSGHFDFLYSRGRPAQPFP